MEDRDRRVLLLGISVCLVSGVSIQNFNRGSHRLPVNPTHDLIQGSTLFKNTLEASKPHSSALVFSSALGTCVRGFAFPGVKAGAARQRGRWVGLEKLEAGRATARASHACKFDGRIRG